MHTKKLWHYIQEARHKEADWINGIREVRHTPL